MARRRSPARSSCTPPGRVHLAEIRAIGGLADDLTTGHPRLPGRGRVRRRRAGAGLDRRDDLGETGDPVATVRPRRWSRDHGPDGTSLAQREVIARHAYGGPLTEARGDRRVAGPRTAHRPSARRPADLAGRDPRRPAVVGRSPGALPADGRPALARRRRSSSRRASGSASGGSRSAASSCSSTAGRSCSTASTATTSTSSPVASSRAARRCGPTSSR